MVRRPQGFGIAPVEIMAGISPTAASHHRAQCVELTDGPLAKGASFVVLDVSRFVPVDAFRAHVDALIDDVHGVGLAPAPRASCAGELEAERRAERLTRGIRLDDAWSPSSTPSPPHSTAHRWRTSHDRSLRTHDDQHELHDDGVLVRRR